MARKKVKKTAFGIPVKRPIDFYEEYMPARRSPDPIDYLKKLKVIDEKKLKKCFNILVFVFCLESIFCLL